MRGSGTIFGTDQSGSGDVGMDLQAKILEHALEDLKKKIVLSGM